jgi:hypothetical protein
MHRRGLAAGCRALKGGDWPFGLPLNRTPEPPAMDARYYGGLASTCH